MGILLKNLIDVVPTLSKIFYNNLKMMVSQFDRDNVIFDRKNNVSTAGFSSHWMYKNTVSKKFPGMQRYEPASEADLNAALGLLKISFDEYIFIDIGCGKGKALIVAGNRGFRTVYGIDYSADLTALAIDNMKRAKIKNYKIQAIDARQFSFPDTKSVVFMYNPFTGNVMDDVLQRISQTDSCKYLVYINPICHKTVTNRLDCELIASYPSFRKSNKYMVNVYKLN